MASRRQSPGSEPQSPESSTSGYPLEVAPEEMMPGPSESEQEPEDPEALEKVEEEEEEKGDAATQAQHSGFQASPRPQGAVRRKRDESQDKEQQEDEEQPCGLRRKRQRQESPVLPEHHQVFRKLLEDPVIKRFLAWDRHLLVSDKYLLAMVIAYFSRSGLFSWQIRRIHFFLALYLANDMEEDYQAPKQNIFAFLYGHSRLQRPLFYRLCLQLLRSMGWRACVNREECEQIQAYDPELWVWGRDRANLL